MPDHLPHAAQVAASLAQQARAFDEGVIFEAALEGPMWEAAANKLGGDAAAAAFVSKLRGAAKQGLVAVEDPLELAKSMGPGALKLVRDAAALCKNWGSAWGGDGRACRLRHT